MKCISASIMINNAHNELSNRRRVCDGSFDIVGTMDVQQMPGFCGSFMFVMYCDMSVCI